MKAIVLIGHGSVKRASGAGMIRVATRLRERRVAPLVEAGFLNYSRPTLVDAVAKVVEAGATDVTVQPYFLIDGVYVRTDLRHEIAEMDSDFPGVLFRIAESFGSHPFMADIAIDRVKDVDPALGTEGRPSALLLIAHGTPRVEANAPIERTAWRIHGRSDYCRALVAFLDCNRPTIPQAIAELVAKATSRIVALPYFLQNGRHVREDVPGLIEAAKQRYPAVEFRLARHLDYDERFVDVIRDRVAEAQRAVEA